MIPIACSGPACLTAFEERAPALHLGAGSHSLDLEPGVYLARPRAGAEVAVAAAGGGAYDVTAIVDGQPARRTPRRLAKVMPSIERRALARFLRRPPPLPPPPRVVRRVLIADEDEMATRRYVRGFGPERSVVATADPALARAIARSGPLDLAIVELRVGRESGIALGLELLRAQPGLAVALCSGYLSVEIAVAAARAGIALVLFKPVTSQEILRRMGATADSIEPDTATLEHAEREHIARVLADCRGNITHAAHRLGIYRSSLQRRLQAGRAATG